MLTDAGVRLPVTVRVVHAKSALVDKAYAALAAGWERAGFDVQLTGVPPEKYYETIEETSSVERYDVFRGVWTSDIPSPSGVLPALFDARINIDSSGPGQDVGYFADDAVAALIDKADGTPDPAARTRVWEQVDEAIRAKGGYIALSATKALHLHGCRCAPLRGPRGGWHRRPRHRRRALRRNLCQPCQPDFRVRRVRSASQPCQPNGPRLRCRVRRGSSSSTPTPTTSR